MAIAEQCFASLNNKADGAEIELSNDKNLPLESLLFGESPSRIVITFAPENAEKVKEMQSAIVRLKLSEKLREMI